MILLICILIPSITYTMNDQGINWMSHAWPDENPVQQATHTSAPPITALLEKMFIKNIGMRCKNLSFQCDSCSRTFVTKKELRHHIARNHDDQAGYLCMECEMKYTTQTSLSLHIKRTHAPKNLECTECSTKYGSRGDLFAHYTRRHPDIADTKKNFECTFCLDRFFSKISLNRHMDSVHLARH